MLDSKKLLDGLCAKVGQFKDEVPSAGTKFRLMGLVEDILEVTAMLLQEVLEVVRREAVLDADVDIDYAEMAEAVLAWELDEREGQNEEMCELTQKANEALSELSKTLQQIDEQLNRHHKDEEYVRLYEAEKRRYLNAGTSKRARQKFGKWKENSCYGHPSQEEMEDYRMEKVLHMFEKGVFRERVEHIQRATRYPGELDFEQLDDDNPMKKTAHRHYAALRKMVDWKDGELVVNPARVGRHFFACRHEPNAKSNRTNFLKYMHKIYLAQEEYRKLLAAQEVENKPETESLNFFAPAVRLKKLLADEWFGLLTTDENRYNQQWTEQFVEALMRSECGEQIAREWAVKEKRLTLKCMVVGVLKDVGVLKGSYNQIAKLMDMNEENPATLAKYMGLGKKQAFAEWIEGYVKK